MTMTRLTQRELLLVDAVAELLKTEDVSAGYRLVSAAEVSRLGSFAVPGAGRYRPEPPCWSLARRSLPLTASARPAHSVKAEQTRCTGQQSHSNCCVRDTAEERPWPVPVANSLAVPGARGSITT